MCIAKRPFWFSKLMTEIARINRWLFLHICIVFEERIMSPLLIFDINSCLCYRWSIRFWAWDDWAFGVGMVWSWLGRLMWLGRRGERTGDPLVKISKHPMGTAAMAMQWPVCWSWGSPVKPQTDISLWSKLVLHSLATCGIADSLAHSAALNNRFVHRTCW